MFSISKGLDIEKCLEDVNRLEVVFFIPDSEEYTIYCNNTKYNFSLDNINNDLPKYITEHGKIGLRIKIY